MGAYASNFHNDSGNIVGDFTHPGKDDWITAHAAASGCKYKTMRNNSQIRLGVEGGGSTIFYLRPTDLYNLLVVN